MGARKILLGIDGGGTKTRCLAADDTGRILGEGLAGPSNYQAVGLEAALAAIRAAAAGAVQAAGAAMADVTAVCAGLAGAGRPEDQALLTDGLACFAPAVVAVVPDARIALVGALAGAPGVTVISGTGSIAFGLDPAGQTVRAGGWGWILGDEGSGYSIGRGAVRAILAALDGSGPATALTGLICQEWGLHRPDQAIGRMYADLPRAKADMAALVGVVMAAAEGGDQVAADLLAGAGQDLAQLAVTVLGRLGVPTGQPVSVAVSGGVLTGCAAVRWAMEAVLAVRAPGACVIDPIESPAQGAVRMAQAMPARGR